MPTEHQRFSSKEVRHKDSMAHIPQVAVVIPFFNEIHKLERAIRSLLKQTHPPHRIILVDDCGAERLKDDILDEIKACGIDPLLIKNKENKGPGGARQAGMDSLTEETDFLLFLDSDDFLSENFIQESLLIHSKRPDIIATFGNTINIETGINRIHSKTTDLTSLLEGLLYGRLWGTGAILWRYDLVRNLKWSLYKAIEDSHFEFSAAKVNPNIAYVQNATLFIHQNQHIERLLQRNRLLPYKGDRPIKFNLFNKMLHEYPFDPANKQDRKHLKYTCYHWVHFADYPAVKCLWIMLGFLFKGKPWVFLNLIIFYPKFLHLKYTDGKDRV
jgi:glycosyltransferase involved in cell wall biosynthesis